jgi:hypothetical protein
MWTHIRVEGRNVLGEPLGYVTPADYVERVAIVERGQVGILPDQGTAQSSFDYPYHRFNPALATDAQLAWQQEATPIGVPDDGLGHQPVAHVPPCDGMQATTRLA